ncbi:MAG TPA: DUF4190 domain-containing protein [Gemmataceae bacterium]|nr:DUF4190 domain-containing protein [Gemmataceae bacterium]
MAEDEWDDVEEPRPRRPRRDRDDPDEYEDDEPRPRRRRRRPPPGAMDDPAMRYLLPVNTSVLAILAGYAGLFAVLCVPAPIALVLGILALVQLKKNPELHGHGRAIFAIVMGIIFTLPLPFILIALLTQK